MLDGGQCDARAPVDLLLLAEQPLAHDDVFDHAKLKPLLRSLLCLDESSASPDHARWAIELQAAGRAVWHGGMLETGISRAVNAALASLPNFTLPGDISANDRYFARDIVRNPFTLNADSTLTVPDSIGQGAVIDEDYLDDVTLERWEISA